MYAWGQPAFLDWKFTVKTSEKNLKTHISEDDFIEL